MLISFFQNNQERPGDDQDQGEEKNSEQTQRGTPPVVRTFIFSIYIMYIKHVKLKFVKGPWGEHI